MVNISNSLADIRNKPRQIYQRWKTGQITFTHYGITDSKNPAFITATLHRDLSALLPELEDAVGRSLEVGCGFGRLTPWIADKSSEHHAIEPNSATLDSARKHHDYVQFKQGVVQEIPYPDNFFDVVHTYAVLMHIKPADIERAVSEMKRVLRPGGVAVLGEQTSMEESSTVFPRSRSEYEALLEPLRLQSYTTRERSHTERFAEELSVMRFTWDETNGQ